MKYIRKTLGIALLTSPILAFCIACVIDKGWIFLLTLLGVVGLFWCVMFTGMYLLTFKED